jgi:putative lumazine-binding protein
MAASESEAVSRVVQLYMDGARDGDVSKLREAFHESAWMFGSLAGTRYDEPITEFFALADGSPADVDGSYKARVTSLEHVGDAALAVVEEEGYWGTVSFTDFFTLARIEGTWKIVNKTFVHTGGEPPAFD